LFDRSVCRATALFGAVLLSGCVIRGATDLPVTEEFTAAGCVEIEGYNGDAMEPFIAPKTGDLLFNNRNSPPELTDLHWARRIDDTHFQYVGAIEGANSTALDAVASVDESGNFFFISMRSYEETLSSIFMGQWSNGVVTHVAPVRGIAPEQHGLVDFDAEISRDGDSLFYVEGRFSGSAVPDSANIALAHKLGERFVRDTFSDVLLGSVNTPALEYAPAISVDRRELFFTRLDPHARTIAIYRAKRVGTGQPFGPAERVAAADGFVEAPALSPDGSILYFHRLVEGQFQICWVKR
jgi:WD40-like Beta Propeller Repeat